MRRYLAAIAVGNLVWEAAQMPLYTLWRTGSTRDIAFAVVHCTGGDVLIAGASLLGGLLLLDAADWPQTRFVAVGGTAIGFGLAYTLYSEHLNTARNAWTYSALMPTLPWLGIGLAPLAQWIVVPVLGFAATAWPPGRKTQPRPATPALDLPTMGSPTSRSVPDHSARPSRRSP